MFCMHTVHNSLGRPVPEQIFCRPLPEPSGAWDACLAGCLVGGSPDTAAGSVGVTIMGGDPLAVCCYLS